MYSLVCSHPASVDSDPYVRLILTCAVHHLLFFSFLTNGYPTGYGTVHQRRQKIKSQDGAAGVIN